LLKSAAAQGFVGSAHTRQETEFPAPSPFLTTCSAYALLPHMH